MEPATTAALIGAGVGSVASISAQFISHRLGLRRDRRNQRRARLYDVIVDAAIAMHEPFERPVPDPDEPEPPPGSVAAMEEFRFQRDPSVRALNDGYLRAVVMLEIHFGRGHPLIEAFTDAFVVVSGAAEAKAEHFGSDDVEWRISNIRALNEHCDGANRARDDWMQLARVHVDQM